MRGLVFDGLAPVLSASCPAPVPVLGEVLIRVEKVIVARTEVEVCHGLFDFHGIPGSAFAGTVKSTPNSEQTEWIGKRVVTSPVIVCGGCDMCRAGLPTHCRKRLIMGLHGRDGALAEYISAPAANLVRLPDSLDNDRAAFAVPVAAAIESARQLTIEGKPYITVLGDGHLGLVVAQIMAKLNASVRVIGRFSEKLAICEKWGIKHRHADDIGRRADQDIVVDCTGTPDGLELALRLVRPRGKVVLKSLWGPQTGRAMGRDIDLTPIVVNEIELIGSFAGPVRDAVGLIARDEIDVLSLITRRMRLQDGPAIIATAARPESIVTLVEI